MPTPAAPRQGVFAALWIPTDARGRLMKRALAAHLAFLRRSGVHGVLALGSTGEFPRMHLAQRQEVLATVAELAGPLQVIANGWLPDISTGPLPDVHCRVATQTSEVLLLPSMTRSGTGLVLSSLVHSGIVMKKTK